MPFTFIVALGIFSYFSCYARLHWKKVPKYFYNYELNSDGKVMHRTGRKQYIFNEKCEVSLENLL